MLNTSALSLTRCARWLRSYGPSWRTSCRRRSRKDNKRFSPSLIGHSGSSAFRLSTTTVSMSLTGSCFSSESAPGALPSWDSRTRRNNLSRGLAVRRTVGPSGHANSPHPSSREGHHSTARWSSSVLIGLDAARFSCCCGLFSGPAELGAVNPYAVHDHSQPACQGHDRLFHPAAPGDLHRPGFEPGPFLRPQHALSCFVEHDPHHLISAA